MEEELRLFLGDAHPEEHIVHSWARTHVGSLGASSGYLYAVGILVCSYCTLSGGWSRRSLPLLEAFGSESAGWTGTVGLRHDGVACVFEKQTASPGGGCGLYSTCWGGRARCDPSGLQRPVSSYLSSHGTTAGGSTLAGYGCGPSWHGSPERSAPGFYLAEHSKCAGGAIGDPLGDFPLGTYPSGEAGVYSHPIQSPTSAPGLTSGGSQ